MVASMQPGSIIVDLAVEAGGNVEGSVRGELATTPGGVVIVGYENLPGRLAKTSSALYAKNLFSLLPLLTGEGGALAPKADDEIIKGMQLTRGGAVVHPSFAKEPA
jgi:NAD(P) transhydrogenase subunit alpha